MTKLLSLICLVIVGVLALMATAPVITKMISALVPLILAVGGLVVAWQLVRYFTRQ